MDTVNIKFENTECILCVCGDNFSSAAAYHEHQRKEHFPKLGYLAESKEDVPAEEYLLEDYDVKEEISVTYEWAEQEETIQPKVEDVKSERGYETLMTSFDRLKREHNYVMREKEYFCEICGKSFASQRAVDAHATVGHTQVHIGHIPRNECLICAQCGERFASVRGVRTHAGLVHGPARGARAARAALPKEPVDCEYCGHSFPSTRSMHMHASRKHAQLWRGAGRGGSTRPAPPRFACGECGRTYGTRTAFRYHQYTHTGERPFACSMCPKQFTSPMYLEVHIRRHTGEKPHTCLQCPMAFPCRAALQRHERIHTGDRPYQCELCGKSFTQSCGRKLHIKTVHLKQPAPPRNRRVRGLPRGESRLRAATLALLQRDGSASPDNRSPQWADT